MVSVSNREAGPLAGLGVYTYLVWVSVHGHREVQVGGDGDGSSENSLRGYAQVLGHFQGSAVSGRGRETQEAAHAQLFPQHLCARGSEDAAYLPGLCHSALDQAHLADTQVAGPEVVGPLGEAVGFVDADKRDRGQPSEAGRASCPSPNQSFGRQH